MTKATQRYDESFTIPADGTSSEVNDLFVDAVNKIALSGADIDWANLEVSSERNVYEEITLTGNGNRVSEYTTVTLTARGRK